MTFWDFTHAHADGLGTLAGLFLATVFFCFACWSATK